MEIPRITPAEVDVQATLRMILKDAVEALAGSAGVVASWIEAERCFVVTDSYRLDVKALDRLRPLLDEALEPVSTINTNKAPRRACTIRHYVCQLQRSPL